jgi:signal transduction histidine kinase
VRPPRTLAGRILGGSALTAALATAALGLLALSVIALRTSVDREAHSRDTLVAALRLEQTFAELEASLRGYLLTTNEVFLEPWRTTRRELVPAERRLATLVAVDREQQQRVAELSRQIHAYLVDYGDPLIQLARINPAIVRGAVAIDERRRRSASITSLFGRIVSVENGRAASRRASVDTNSGRAIAAAVACAALAAIWILVAGLLIARAVRRRLGGAAAAASQIAGGDFAVRLDERGPRELQHLAGSFNAMARSLDDGRRELLEQNARLEESERQKSELITVVSHELRTPLTSLLGFTNLLLARSFGEEEQRRYIGIVHEESRRLAGLVETFLDLRSIEEGRLELRRGPVAVGSLVREQAEFLLAHAPLHELALRLPEDDVVVDADADRLAQVVANLVGNAVKYSPDGGPIEVVVLPSTSEVRIEVTDHGRGIAPDDQPHVFTKFFRGAATEAGIPGTGLGLSVAREIVEAHGGEIGFISAPARGSTFWIELPRPAPAGSGGGVGAGEERVDLGVERSRSVD